MRNRESSQLLPRLRIRLVEIFGDSVILFHIYLDSRLELIALRASSAQRLVPVMLSHLMNISSKALSVIRRFILSRSSVCSLSRLLCREFLVANVAILIPASVNPICIFKSLSRFSRVSTLKSLLSPSRRNSPVYRVFIDQLKSPTI